MINTLIEDLGDPRNNQESACEPRNYCTADELAQVLQLSTGFIYKLARQKRIPFIRIGRSIRFDIDEVKKTLSESTRRNR